MPPDLFLSLQIHPRTAPPSRLLVPVPPAHRRWIQPLRSWNRSVCDGCRQAMLIHCVTSKWHLILKAYSFKPQTRVAQILNANRWRLRRRICSSRHWLISAASSMANKPRRQDHRNLRAYDSHNSGQSQDMRCTCTNPTRTSISTHTRARAPCAVRARHARVQRVQ